MNTILPVASGKGGVGKSIFATNLGITLAKQGKTVILVDLDLGASNLHTCLGVKNRHPGIGNYIQNREGSLESLVVETERKRLYFIPGDSLLPGTANLPYFTKRKIIREIHKLTADFTILDLGSGSAYNTVDFFLTSNRGLIVTTPETTSILNAYSFLKTSLYRLLHRSFPPKSRERDIITEFISRKIEGSDQSFETLGQLLAEVDPASGEAVRERLTAFFPRVILNRGKTARDLALGGKLREVSGRNLSIGLEYIGFIPQHDSVERSIIERTPAVEAEPGSPFAKSLASVAEKLLRDTHGSVPQLYEADEDLAALRDQAEWAAQG